MLDFYSICVNVFKGEVLLREGEESVQNVLICWDFSGKVKPHNLKHGILKAGGN